MGEAFLRAVPDFGGYLLRKFVVIHHGYKLKTHFRFLPTKIYKKWHARMADLPIMMKMWAKMQLCSQKGRWMVTSTVNCWGNVFFVGLLGRLFACLRTGEAQRGGWMHGKDQHQKL